MNGYEKIWALFGSANQLLAALGLLAVATWLGRVGRNNKMFLIPMAFMLFVTIASLLLNTWEKLQQIGSRRRRLGVPMCSASSVYCWWSWPLCWPSRVL